MLYSMLMTMLMSSLSLECMLITQGPAVDQAVVASKVGLRFAENSCHEDVKVNDDDDI